MRKTILICATFFLATAARAQTTDCYSYGHNTYCTSREHPAQVSPSGGVNQSDQSYAAPDRMLTPNAEAQARANTASADPVETRVGRLVAAHRCEEAKGAALDARDRDLVERVIRYCTPE